jgi:hypothetical protein
MIDRPPPGPDTCELDRIEGREVLDAWARRWLHHLHTGCKRCWASLADRSSPEPSLEAAELARILEKVQAEAPHLFAETVQDRKEASRFVDRLARLAPEHQRLVIANSKWAGTAAVCDVLIERSLKTRWVDEATTLHFAELAVQAAGRLPADAWLAQNVRALIQLGAALKVNSRFAAALQVLDSAECLLLEGYDEPLLLAELRSVQTSLSNCQGRFWEALQLNKDASALYARCGSMLGEGQRLISLGVIYSYSANPSLALAPTAQALRIGKELNDLRLRLLAYINLIDIARESGDLRTSEIWLNDSRPLFATSAPPRLRRQFEWVEARQASGRASLRGARSKLHELRDQFSCLNMHGHVRSVNLDLAKVYLGLGHRPAARELLLEVLEICRALDIKHQAREAHALLQG